MKVRKWKQMASNRFIVVNLQKNEQNKSFPRRNWFLSAARADPRINFFVVPTFQVTQV